MFLIRDTQILRTVSENLGNSTWWEPCFYINISQKYDIIKQRCLKLNFKNIIEEDLGNMAIGNAECVDKNCWWTRYWHFWYGQMFSNDARLFSNSIHDGFTYNDWTLTMI